MISPGTKADKEECDWMSRLSQPVQKYLMIVTLIYYGQATSVCCSIRYGFLADSFSGLGISGKVYGVVEGSMFIGFLGIYLVGGVERVMRHVNSRYLLATITGSFAVTSLATGLVFLIDNNLILITVSTALRVVQGVLSYACSLVAVDFINAQLSTQFDLVNGLLSMGFFSGYGIAEVMGCVLYDSFGYVPPFLFACTMAITATCFIITIIPKSATYLASQEGTLLEDLPNASSRRITKVIFLPIAAIALINLNYGALQVTVTPFLHDEFDKSISYGGFVLINVSVGMTLGSVITGVLLQNKALKPGTIMAFGALFVCLGILATFPPRACAALYELAPVSAFVGVFLASMGEPLITIASLRELYDLQLQRTGILTPKSVTQLTGTWLIGYSALYYSGTAVAGILLDYLTYTGISDVFFSTSLVSLLLCGALKFVPRTKPSPSNDETVSLIP